ncbi:MAG TPA: DUF4383 domain-containing protein [Gammaproteobacteria bacterium]
MTVVAIRNFALVYGIVFLLVGIAGFVPGFVTPMGPADPPLEVTAGAGRLFGFFPVNYLHNIVHIAFGVWGLAVYRNASGAVMYARAVAVVYAVLTVLGLIPAANTLFGLVPLHSHDVWLHLLLAAIAAYFGFVVPRHEAPAGTPHRA